MTNDFDIKNVRKQLDALRAKHGADSPCAGRTEATSRLRGKCRPSNRRIYDFRRVSSNRHRERDVTDAQQITQEQLDEILSEHELMRKTLEVIVANSADRLQATQARGALANIGPAVTPQRS